jgi:Asp-tRNA(Asn)/Glu-tRNA(Gln) amidotransferase A subunit family amidase
MRRRRFLKQIPIAVATGLAAPELAAATSGAPPAPQAGSAPPPGALTVETLGAAQQVAAVDLPAAERLQALPLVQRNVANIAAVRELHIPQDVDPIFGFRPPRPPRVTIGTRSTAAMAAPGPRPADLEAVAFESVRELGARLRAKQFTSTELTRMYLERLRRADPTLLCVVTLTEERALAEAAAADAEIRAGRWRGPLHGIPYGIKDLFATKGIRTTWGAAPYKDVVPDMDATAVVRMREAGAVLVAKLTTGELAVGDLWFGGRTRNPWNPERGASGSSAGPASAAAAGLVGVAIGTETNGSILSPASTCGVAGLRPTYGRASRHGCMTLRWTLDKVGAIGRFVEDTSLVLEVLAGPDGHDETVADLPYQWNGDTSLDGLRIGVIEDEFSREPAARRAVYDAALGVVRRLGATLVPVSMPAMAGGALYALLNAEAGAMFDDLVRSGGINELADTGAGGRANQLRAARFIPAVDYIQAQRARTLLLREVSALYERVGGVHTILAPSSTSSVTTGNLTGHPAISVNAGFVDGLPVGLVVNGPLFFEDRVVRVAAAFERAAGWSRRHPTVR